MVKKNSVATESTIEPAPTPLAVGVTPAPVHKQSGPSESRVALQSVGVAYGGGTVKDIITPNMTAMQDYANTVLRYNSIPMLTTPYAPNEMPSLLHALQVKLGV